MTSGDWNAAIEADLLPCPHSVGDRVYVNADMLPSAYREDWRDVQAIVAGVRYAPAMAGGYDITITETWPPQNGDLTDGFEADSLANLTRQPTTPTTGEDAVELVEALRGLADHFHIRSLNAKAEEARAAFSDAATGIRSALASIGERS